MAALDFESSDKDPATARIVTCALIRMDDGQPVEARTWLLNPGVPQHPDAVKVHGITDEYAAEHGQPAAEGVAEIAEAVAAVVREGLPLVGHNIGGYDLNLLDAECARHGLGSLLEVCGGPLGRVLDTMVLDRHAAPFRKRVSESQGPYQMRTTAEVYGLGWDEAAAHGAEYDALQSGRAAHVMGCIAGMRADRRPEWVLGLRNWRGPYERFDDLVCDVDELHRRQVAWAASDAASYQAWLRSPKAKDKQDPAAVVDGSWPLRGAQ
jgi:DNA polymerase-3 subunit epsilon